MGRGTALAAAAPRERKDIERKDNLSTEAAIPTRTYGLHWLRLYFLLHVDGW